MSRYFKGEVMNVLVFGSRGWLGGCIRDYLHTVKFIDKVHSSTIRIEHYEEVREILHRYDPDVVINCAGKAGGPLGENIDWCEQAKAATWRSNVLGPAIIKDACDRIETKFVHLGSGCIFTEGNALTEESEPTPNSYYGITKVNGDQLLMNSPGPSPLILRLRMPIHHVANPRNILDKILKYENVIDIKNSMTYVPTLCKALEVLLKYKRSGIFNIVNHGSYSAWDIVQKYKEMYPELVRPTVKPVDMEELYKTRKVITGRSNCTLSTHKLELETGFKPEPLDLEKIIRRHGTSLGVIDTMYTGEELYG